MNPAPSAAADAARTPEEVRKGNRLYTPSFSDGLGDRLLMFDNNTGLSLELLRFKKEFTDAPGFEPALRERLDQLKAFHHPSVAAVRSVERLDADAGGGLALVSKLTPGRRLSDLLPKARGPVFALELVRQLTPALVALHQAGPNVAHGAIAAERVVVAREGRLVLVEHVLGSALESLRLPGTRIRSELGVAVPTGRDPMRLDGRTDVVHLGFLALSLLLGRRLEPLDYPAKVAELLDEFAGSEGGSSPAAARLRAWLESALQLGGRPFTSAQEAHSAFDELPESFDAASDSPQGTVLAFQNAGDAAPRAQAPAAVDPKPEAAHKPELKPVVPNSPVDVKAAAVAKIAASVPARPIEPPVAVTEKSAPAVPAQPRAKRGGSRWLVPALSALCAIEAAVIGGILYTRPAPLVVEVKSPTPTPAERAQAPARPEPVQTAAAPAPPPVAPRPDVATVAASSDAPTSAEARQAPLSGRFGGIRVSSPIDLAVLEGGKLIGSSAGPIALNEGSHVLEVVNDALAFRFQQSVTVKPGQMGTLTIALPNGRISINAVPWAEVTIDGNAAGQTPIANFALPIGQHEIVFRHPQFGEQRQTAVVKAEGLTRVSATLQR
jgi:hypothetical protein